MAAREVRAFLPARASSRRLPTQTESRQDLSQTRNRKQKDRRFKESTYLSPRVYHACTYHERVGAELAACGCTYATHLPVCVCALPPSLRTDAVCPCALPECSAWLYQKDVFVLHPATDEYMDEYRSLHGTAGPTSWSLG